MFKELRIVLRLPPEVEGRETVVGVPFHQVSHTHLVTVRWGYDPVESGKDLLPTTSVIQQHRRFSNPIGDFISFIIRVVRVNRLETTTPESTPMTLPKIPCKHLEKVNKYKIKSKVPCTMYPYDTLWLQTRRLLEQRVLQLYHGLFI